MLVGRQLECGRIEALLDQARASDGRVLVVRGLPGVGKSALLRFATERASGMQVLRATGVAWEAELAFSGLLELLGPVLGNLEQLPEPQRWALEGALALAPAVERDRFAVGAATLRLLSLAAAARPLLLVIDDAQWLDSGSLEAVLFAARRLGGEAVAVLVGVRADHPTAIDEADVPSLVLDGLDHDATAALARRLLDAPLTPRQIDGIFRVTRGYPLAIEELGRLGDLPEDGEGPLPISRSVELAYARDIERCDEDVRALLLLAAADDSGEVATVLAAAARLGLDPAALDAAEAAGFIDVAAGRLSFRHPLARSAVYQKASAAARRATHNALADSLEGDWRADRRAWHRAAGALGPDEEIAAGLEASAERTRARSGYAAAARALERAAHLTPDPEAQAKRLVTAADALWHAGRGARAEELLGTALERTADPLLRADAQQGRGRLAHFRGDPASACALLVQESARVAAHDGRRAAEMLATSVISALCCGDRRLMLETITLTARQLEGLGADVGPAVAAQAGAALAVCGRLDAATPYLLRAIATAEASDDPQLLAYAADSHGWLSQYPQARRLAARARDRAREEGELSALAYAAHHLTDYETALGNLHAATVTAGEAQQIARETGQPQILAWSMVYLAYIAGLHGQLDRMESALQHAREPGIPLWFNGIDTIEWVRGAAHLAAGETDAAIVALEGSIDRPAEHTNWVPWTVSTDLIEAYVHAGRLDEALAAVETLAKQAKQEWALAALARVRGLVVETDFDAPFQASIAAFAALCVPLEQARSQLAYGERLRRDRRRVEARVQLRAAGATFERLGARLWGERARAELRATGATVESHRTAASLEELTPQELQVALIVADGISNKAAAARLFLSIKTVEAHLHRTYRKLGIDSRSELARLVAARAPEPAPQNVGAET
jgi:DNA-binding CsgD family transcriptional regulator